MASYCQQCSVDLFGKDSKDFAVPDNEITDPDAQYYVICEGCGHALVDIDGRCTHLGGHEENK